jgi:hypothetical protein
MMNVKEFAAVRTEGRKRAAAMNSARSWAASIRTPSSWHTAKDLKNYAQYKRAALKDARKAHAKVMAAKRAGSARPVGLVLATVLPLMDTMANSAAERTLEHIAEVRAKVAAEGLDVAFPEPVRLETSERWNRLKVAQYDAKVYARSFAARVSGLVESVDAEEFAASEVEDAVYHARAQFLAFAWKLEIKVGAVTAAALETVRGVWGESYLRVTTAAGVAQCWKTQTIVNRSVLGKLFFQFPTRIVKM